MQGIPERMNKFFSVAAKLKVLLCTPSEVGTRDRFNVKGVITSYQINLGSHAFQRVKLCQIIKWNHFIIKTNFLRVFRTSPRLLQLLKRMLQHCLAVKVQKCFVTTKPQLKFPSASVDYDCTFIYG